MSQITQEIVTLKVNTNIIDEELDALDEAIGMKMSVEALNALKTVARAKAGQAETGASVPSYVVREGFMIETLNNTAIIAEGRKSETALLRQKAQALFNFERRAEGIASQALSPVGAMLSVGTSAVGSFQTGLNFLNTTQQTQLLGSTATP